MKTIKIKVTVPETTTYYDIEVVDDEPPYETAEKEAQLFRNGELSWEDIIGSASRGAVIFEGVGNA